MKRFLILAACLALLVPVLAIGSGMHGGGGGSAKPAGTSGQVQINDGAGGLGASTVTADGSGNLTVPGNVVVGTTDLGTPALNATATLSGQVGKITIANNCIIDLTSWPASGTEGKKTLYMTNPGAATITWKTGGSALTPKYASGSAPTWTASGLDVVVLTSIDGGTTVYLFVAGQDAK